MIEASECATNDEILEVFKNESYSLKLTDAVSLLGTITNSSIQNIGTETGDTSNHYAMKFGCFMYALLAAAKNDQRDIFQLTRIMLLCAQELEKESV